MLLHWPPPKGGYLGCHGAPSKGGRGYFVIRFVEFVWKKITSIVNKVLAVEINLYDVLHGFRDGRRLGTAIVEKNLPH